MSSSKMLFEGASPQSSFGGASVKGTPDTDFTHYSPPVSSDTTDNDKISAGFVFNASGLDSSGFYSAFNPGNYGSTVDKDPFISPSAPFTSTFQPFGIHLVSQGITSQPMIAQGSGLPIVASSSRTSKGSVNLPMQSSPSGSQGSVEVQRGTFSTDTSVTRTLKVFGIYEPMSTEQLEDCLQVSIWSFSLSR